MKVQILAFLLLAQFFTGNTQEINLEENLVARYLFNGNARNEVEDKNHGEGTSVRYETDRFGNAAACVYITGETSYITIPHNDDLNWDARLESYSIAFWIKSPKPTGGSNTSSRVLSKWHEVLSESYPYSFQFSDEIMAANIFDHTSGGVSSTLNKPWDGEWQHAAMVYSFETNTLSSYLNGEMVESNTRTFDGSTSNNADIYIGRTYTPVVEGFYQGHFDDLYFYDRAIEACEVETLYSGQLLQQR